MIDGSRVFLNPENPGHLGDDTFWRWFKRVFPESSWDWQNAKAGDVVLQYSVLGPYVGPAKYIALCWEMYPEMQRVLPASIGNWDEKVKRCLDCAAGTPWRTVPTLTTAHYYEQFGSVEILPLAVDTDLFRPLAEKEALRNKYGIADGTVGFWCGTTHYMKGFDLLQAHAKAHPEIKWIICWKQPGDAGHMDGAYGNTVSILQPHMNELMNCADFVASTGRLEPLFLVEWEAMASGLMLWNVDGVEREMISGSTRKHVFERFWDRRTAKRLWSDYIDDVLCAP